MHTRIDARDSMRITVRLTWASLLVVGGGGTLFAVESPAHAQWEADIGAFEQADRLSPPPPDATLFVGSSSIRMWTTLAADFPNSAVINRGFGGSQIDDATYFADRIIIPYRPRTIVLYAGDNDLANGLTPDQVAAHFRQFVRTVRMRLPSVRILYVSIKPSPLRAELLPQQGEANAKIREFIATEEQIVYVDIASPMLRSDGTIRDELFIEDRLHLNRQGYDLWKSVIGRHLAE